MNKLEYDLPTNIVEHFYNHYRNSELRYRLLEVLRSHNLKCKFGNPDIYKNIRNDFICLNCNELIKNIVITNPYDLWGMKKTYALTCNEIIIKKILE